MNESDEIRFTFEEQEDGSVQYKVDGVLSNIPSWCKEYRKTATARAVKIQHPFEVCTQEGVMHGERGDYLMIGVIGELYICAKDTFALTYESVEEERDEED